MNIETKYNINDTIFFIKDSVIVTGKVIGIKQEVGYVEEKKSDGKRGLIGTGLFKPLLKHPVYEVIMGKTSSISCNRAHVQESYAFKTKESLIAFLSA